MFIKRIIVFIITFLVYIFFSSPVLAYAGNDYVVVPVPDQNADSSKTIPGYVDDDGNVVVDSGESDKTDGISFSFTFFGHDYTFNISFLDSFMPIVRDIIFYFLLAKSVFTKFKALPSIIGHVPVIGPSDFQQIAMYNSKYGR